MKSSSETPIKEKVPFFRTWKQWYFFVIGILLLLIIFFSLFTKYFS